MKDLVSMSAKLLELYFVGSRRIRSVFIRKSAGQYGGHVHLTNIN